MAAEQKAQQEARKILDAAGIPGGLVVHLGCGDGRLTAALGRSGRFLVQGLDRREEAVAEARRFLSAEGLYGRTSVARLSGGGLPYVDGLVNLIVVEDRLGVDRKEVLRVLAPLGVVMVGTEGGWVKHVKPWPEEIDEWTHFLHGPDNNAVARDHEVGPPSRLQWLADPRHLRSHEHLNSVSALVSSRGRIFYVIDEGPTASVAAPPQWRLVARDAFNGLLLWKRDLGPWEGHFRLFRSGPPDVARRLVAEENRVYVTLGYGKRAAALDAATGETVRIYDETEGAVEIVHSGGCLFVIIGTIDEEAYSEAAKRFYPSPAPRHKGIVALDADSGRVLWKRLDADTDELMPTALAVAAGRLFFQNTRELICLDAASGRERWRADRPVHTTRLAWSAPTLVACDDVVLSSDGPTGGLPAEAGRGAPRVEWIMSDTDIRKHPPGDLVALNAQTGERLWTTETLQGFCCPGDVFVIDGLVWAGALVAPSQQTLDVALNLTTGEVVRRRDGDGPPVGGHARCYRNKATERFLVLGGAGVEMVDLSDWSWTADLWVRGTCQYGVMPSNGLLYVPPDSCACRPNVRLHGFTAMAPKRALEAAETSGDGQSRLQRGPAYDKTSGQQAAAGRQDADAWPTYRHDGARSGWTKSKLAARLEPAWQTEIGGRLTSPTAGAGKVYVSRVDAHAVFALDAASGEVAWRRTVGGPVDSPPTVSRGRVVFGCRDGWVYCLRGDDGALAWRFRAAPEERLLIAREAIESAWPVHGSVLVKDGLVWLAAGRSSYLDGGIHLYALELLTGKPAIQKRLDGRDSQSWLASTSRRAGANRLPGTLPDILSTSGDAVFMGWTCFDAAGQLADVAEPHLFSATGFLDDTWWHRTYWQYGTWMRGGFGGWPQAARRTPAGRLMVVNDDTVFGFGRSKYDAGNPERVHAGHVGVIKDGYQDSGRVDHSQNPQHLYAAVKPGTEGAAKGKPGVVRYKWQTPAPMLVRGMVLADQTLFIAGPAARQNNRGLAELATVQPGLLRAVSAADGTTLADGKLAAAPVLDGMAAVSGRLLISCTDGSVRCLAGR
jgi:outer membrane protein assembly factor BamB